MLVITVLCASREECRLQESRPRASSVEFKAGVKMDFRAVVFKLNSAEMLSHNMLLPYFLFNFDSIPFLFSKVSI